MKTIRNFILIGLVTAVAVVLPANAQDKSKDFEGTVSSINKSAQTVVVDGDTYQVLPTTRITKNERTATFSDLSRGQRVSGTYKQSAENKMELLTMDITRDSSRDVGGSTGGALSESGKTFDGKIKHLSTSDNTFRIGTHTYYILPSTTIRTMSGQRLSLSDLKDNQHVSGTYKESEEGHREVLSLDVGKKSN